METRTTEICLNIGELLMPTEKIVFRYDRSSGSRDLFVGAEAGHNLLRSSWANPCRVHLCFSLYSIRYASKRLRPRVARSISRHGATSESGPHFNMLTLSLVCHHRFEIAQNRQLKLHTRSLACDPCPTPKLRQHGWRWA